MITRENFLTEFNGHSNSYSKYLIIGKTANDIIEFLNQKHPNVCVGSGVEKDGNVTFEICGELPDLIYEITNSLHTRGYADIDWETTYTICAENGVDFEDYIATWEEGMCYRREEDEELWDAFVNITDPSGAVFNTGAGAVCSEIKKYYSDIVEKHPVKDKISTYIAVVNSYYIRDTQVFLPNEWINDKDAICDMYEKDNNWKDARKDLYLGIYTWVDGDTKNLINYVAKKHGLQPETLEVYKVL